MKIFPAIDIYRGQAVRLYKGEYGKMTVYSPDPCRFAYDFAACGADGVHIVDLYAARDGSAPDIDTAKRIKKASGLFCEAGGGIRSMETVEKYLSTGIDRVIIGTSAIKDPGFLKAAVKEYGKKIAVGADIKNGSIALNGWEDVSETDIFSFCETLCMIGVRTVIITDVSKDGALEGTNHSLYREVSKRFELDIVASGGVSSIDDVIRLKALGVSGAIIGRAYYENRIDLKKAVEVSK